MKNTQQLGSDIASNPAKKVDEAIDTGRKYIDELSTEYSKKFKDGFEVVKEKTQLASTEINAFVKQRPLVALGVALGAGLIIGRMFASTGTRRE